MKDLEQYLADVVEPTIQDFVENPTSVRHAFLACVVTCHAVDYLAFPRKPQATRAKFRKESKDYKLVDLAGHAFKHVITGNRVKPDLRAKAVIRRPPAAVGDAIIGLSRVGDRTGGVTLKDDPTVDLLTVVKNAAAFLRSKINVAD